MKYNNCCQTEFQQGFPTFCALQCISLQHLKLWISLSCFLFMRLKTAFKESMFLFWPALSFFSSGCQKQYQSRGWEMASHDLREQGMVTEPVRHFTWKQPLTLTYGKVWHRSICLSKKQHVWQLRHTFITNNTNIGLSLLHTFPTSAWMFSHWLTLSRSMLIWKLQSN